MMLIKLIFKENNTKQLLIMNNHHDLSKQNTRTFWIVIFLHWHKQEEFLSLAIVKYLKDTQFMSLSYINNIKRI